MSDTPVKLPMEMLDRSRAFGYVQGDTAHNIKFEQRGWPYDAHGHLIESALTPAQKATLADKRERAVKRAVEQPVQAEALLDEEEIEDIVDKKVAEEDPDSDDDVNLEAWLKGEQKYPAHELQAALKKRFGVNKARLADIALYLVEDKKLVPPGLVAKGLLPKRDRAA